jgi:hypothetical protein
VLEEKEHSAAFARLAQSLSDGSLRIAPADRHALVEDAESLPDFVAYVHAGELDVAREFGAYAAAANVPEAARLFQQIQIEEEGHEGGLWDVLIAMIPDEKQARTLVRQARRRRWWEAWKQLGRNMGDVVSSIWLGALYLIFGPLILIASRRRLIEGRSRR